MPDDISVGRSVRAVRLSKNLSQAEVARRAGIDQAQISRLERGLIEPLTMRTLRAISRALDMPPVMAPAWRSPELDKLRDRMHAALVEAFVGELERAGWRLAPENSFSLRGERGSADILAWHEAGQALLIAECKTRIWDVQDLLSSMDRKRRLLPGEATRRWGWRAAFVGVLLVMPEMSTHRHVIERYAATFRAALPKRQRAVRAWLMEPGSDMAGILFLPNMPQTRVEQRLLRIRASKSGRKAGIERASGSHEDGKGPREAPAPAKYRSDAN